MSTSRNTDPVWINGARLVLILFAVGIALFVKDLKKVSISSGDSSLWLPEGTREGRIFKNFTKRFGADDMLLVSWEGCRFDDPKLNELAKRLEVEDIKGSLPDARPRYFKSITTWQDIRDSVKSETFDSAEMDRRVEASLKGFLIGSDGETGVIVMEGTAYCADHREEVLAFVKNRSEAFLGPGEKVRFSGPVFLSVCGSKETRSTLVYITPIVALVSLCVTLILLRNVTLALLSFSASGIAAMMSVAAIHYGGKDLGDMLSVVPSVAQLLAMSNAVHFINYYSEEWLKHRDSSRAWRYAVRVGWLPTVTASLTTIVGFAALGTSNIGVAGDFALFGGIAVFCSAFTVLLVVPSVLILFRPSVREPLPIESGFIKFLLMVSDRYRKPVAIAMSLLLVVCGVGLGKLESNVRLEAFFPEDSEFHEDYKWFAKRFSAPQSSELEISFPADLREVRAVERFQLIEKLTADILSRDESYAIFSPTVFASGIPEKDEDGKVIPKIFLEFIYQKLLKELRGTDWIKIENDIEYWRVSIRHPPAPTPKDSKFFADVKPILATAGRDLEPQPRIVLTGSYLLFTNAQDGLLTQLLRTFLFAFIIITPIIIIFLRSLKLGLIAIVGNLFPLVVFFGAMGWLGQRIDIATMMIAAVAFGIAVDDTVHFLTWLGRGFDKGHRLGDSIRFAFENSAGAILQTTLIISIGMMAFLLSDFLPSVRFATFSSAVLLIAVIGDLIFLPCLIRWIRLGPIHEKFHGSLQPVAWFGRFLIGLGTYFGEIGKLIATTVYSMATSPPRIRLCCEQAISIGLNSLLLIIVTGIFTGAVFAAQMYFAFSGYGLGTTVGAVVSITVCRELAPVLTALMLSGRVGTAMAAQIGNMKSTQQIDALHCMGVNPVEYLVVPRFTAMLISSPILNVVAMGCGILSSHFIAVYLFKVPSEWYGYQTWVNTNISDLTIGVIKGIFFGAVIVFVACHQGLKTEGGTEGVGKAIKTSVVSAALLVVILNLFLSLALNLFFPLELRNY